MSKQHFDTYDGLYPIQSPRNLPEKAAQVAENMRMEGTRLDPVKVPTLVQALANNVSIFPWRRSSATEWLSWAIDTDVVQSPIANDQYERIYLADGVSPRMLGRASGVTVERTMSRPTGVVPTGVATDRVGFGASEMASCTAVWGGTVTGTYKKTEGGVTTQETITPFPNNFIGTLQSATRDKNTGLWTVSFLFNADHSWYYSGPVGVRITDIVVSMVGTWTVTFAGAPSAIGTTITLNDGSVDYGTALVSGVLPIPTYKIGKANVTFPSFTGSIQFIPTFVDSSFIRYVNYVQTFVDDWGMEGPPSAASKEVTWLPGQKVVVSATGSGTDIVKRRLYRSVAGTSEDTYMFLCELDIGVTSYTDILTASELGEEIPLFENPPNDMKGIVMLPANFAATFRGNELLFSEPKYPWSWPTEYRVTTDWNIVGLGVLGNDLYVLTEGQPYLVTGYHPEDMVMAKLAAPQACVSKKSIAPLGPYMCYASPDGLMGISGGQVHNLTQKYHSRVSWQELVPTGMIGAVHDEQYFGFHAAGAIVFRMYGGGNFALTSTTETVTTARYDLITDTLYYVKGLNLYSWNTGATNMLMKWRSKEFPTNRRQNWTCARVQAETYTDVQFLLYAENVLISTIDVTSQTAFRVPKMYPERTWSLEVRGRSSINRVLLGTSKMEIA